MSLAPSLAMAQDARTVEMARSLYDAGAQAYSVGKYAAAVKAFEEAYRLTPRPTIAFSMAQAHRRQYVLTKQPENLRGAIKYFREYTSQVEQGGRVDDATEALAQLEPIAARLDAAAPVGAPPVAPPSGPAKAQTAQLMVSPEVKEAMVSLDGSAPSPVPFIKDVPAGPHKLKVTAEGYFDYVRDIDVKAGAVVPVLDVPLREKPARLVIECQPGSDVSIDGRLAATTPLLTSLEIPAGRHFIAVTKGGHKPVSQELDVKRGETKTILLNLETTGQRIAAYTGLIGSAGSIVGGVIVSLLAAGQDAKAQEVLDKQSKHNITNADLGVYNTAREDRDKLRNAAGGLIAIGTVLGAGGLLLYVFDQPPAVVPPLRSEESPKKAPKGPTPMDPSIELVGSPVWSPGYVGASIIGRF